MLALLAIEGERSGYDLLKLVSTAIAHVWSPAKTQLYAVLPRLERDGFATARSVAQTNRPDKRLYKISKGGLVFDGVIEARLDIDPGSGF